MRGAIMKGGHGNIHMHGTNGNNRRGWSVYLLTLVILLVFGGAVLGCMGTQRLRDRRIFNLLIKEKENQILSLQLLLQNEREHVQDGKMKAEELKMKVYNLRSQKKELHGKILEMQSTMSSLKEEQKTLESAYEEQQNEAKLLREKCSQNPQVESLTELLRQKEAEIDELHSEIQLPAKVSSVNKDDRSILPEKINLPGRETKESGENPRDGERSTRNDTSRIGETESSIQTGGKREDEKISENRKIAFGRRNGHRYDLQSGESSEIETKKNDSETELNENGGNEEQKPKDEDSDGQEMITVHKGGVKLEVQNKDNGSNRFKGKHGYLKRTKGKRWRAIMKETNRKSYSGSDEAKITMADQKFTKHDERANSKAYARGSSRENIEDSPPGNNRLQHKINQIEENGQQGIHTNSSSVESNVSVNEVQQYKFDGKTSGSSNEGIKQHIEEAAQQSNEPEETMIRQHTENENSNIDRDASGIKAEANKNQDDDDMKDSEESEMVTDGSGEFGPGVQKNSEEAEAGEPEF